MKSVVKLMSVAACATFAVLAAAQPSHAQNAPWCGSQMGPGAPGTLDCRYSSFSQCRTEMLSGNRGSCMRNPSGGRASKSYKMRRHYKDGRRS
jgi:hypothetical protein